MNLVLDPSSVDDYRMFLKVKQLPRYTIRGRVASFPDEYASRIGLTASTGQRIAYKPQVKLFDYQEAIAALAIEKQKFALFIDCGLGKTLVYLEYALHCLRCLPKDKAVLIVSPLMVVEQTVSEARKFYGEDYPIEIVASSDVGRWLESGTGRIGITNYEAFKHDIKPGRLGALIPDESSMLKSHYGKYGRGIIELGKGLNWKLAGTGTPAPNDRIEYANHAVFLDQFPTVNAFLAKYFVNRGQTDNRWELKPHALEPFYRSLSHWSIFLTNPATYGWADNCETIPPIHVHIHNVDLTHDQEKLVTLKTGQLFATEIGGIVGRTAMGTIAKGFYKGRAVTTNKPQYIKELVETWPEESTLIWCLYNEEQKTLLSRFPNAANISGDTPHEERMRLINDFKAGRRKQLISKPKILGFGLNLQIATRQVFSGLQDSYESFYQAVKRSNRYGSTKPLNVHIPITDIEAPMVDTVLRKSRMVQQDSENQERIFRSCSLK